MTWTLTAHGQEVDMAYPRAGAITLADVAHHLSQINRFTGAACRPYSVAEHSLLVCEIAERELGLGVHGQLAALLHDAHEAYTNDISTPAKRAIGVDWSVFESRFMRLVRSSFSVTVASNAHAAAIREADLRALATERAQLLPPGAPWAVLQGVEPVGWIDLMSPERQAMTWRDWRQAFTDSCQELEYARGEGAATSNDPARTCEARGGCFGGNCCLG